MKKKDLVICILFYEKLDQTIECIQSFLSSKVKIYILNNGSSKSARKKLGKFCSNYKQIKIFDSNVNLGVGVGRNYLITHTKEKWLFFVDSDISVETSNWLQKFNQYVSEYPDIEVFIPKLFNIHEKKYVLYGSLKIQGNKAIYGVKIENGLTNSFPGGASFINRKLFKHLGLYDKKMFIGFEDFEFCIRAIRLGNPIKVYLINNIELIHNHCQAKYKKDKKAILTRYNIQHLQVSFNRIIEKHGIILKDDWKNWTANQIKKSIKNKSSTFIQNWKLKIPNHAKKIFIQTKKILKKTFNLSCKSIPYSCSLYMTKRCNFKCLGCYRSVIGIKKSKEMTLPTVQKLFSLYPSISAFCMAGLGEPTLCPNFIDIVNFLKKNKKYVGIITNGTNSDKLLKLTYEPNYISISLKGYNSQTYLTNTGVNAFNKVIKTFSKLKSNYNNIGFSYALNKSNYKDLKKLLLLCDHLKPDFFHLTNYLVYNPNISKEIKKIITIKDSKIINYIDKICGTRDYITVKPIYVDFNNPKFNCGSYEYVINLDGDGNIGGCQRQIPPSARFGNIFTDKDPYNSLKMRKIRKQQIHKKSNPHKECFFCFGNWEQ